MSDSALLATSESFVGQADVNGSAFPLLLVPRESDDLSGVTSAIREQRASLERLLTTHGAILFRGFPVASADDFDRFVSAFGFANFPYGESLSNAVRVNYTERVFSANEAPADVTIYLHHEMAQTPVFPTRIFFFCETPAESGGATPLCRSDVLFARIAEELPEFAAACAAHGLRYTNVMPSANDAASGQGRSWQSTFGAGDRSAAEAKLRGLGYTWEWTADGDLKATTPTLPAVKTLPDGRQVFFNQLIAAFKGWKDSRNDPSDAIRLGDGSTLDRAVVLRVADIAEDLTVDTPWQAGDVALVDNEVVMHGRRAFSGKRRVLASLAAKATH